VETAPTRLIALLFQLPHFPIFDWLLASLTSLAQCTNILSPASQEYLPIHCRIAAGFFLFFDE